MVTKKDIRKLFDITQAEEEAEQLKEKALHEQEIEAEKKAQMLEYFVEHTKLHALIAAHRSAVGGYLVKG